MQLKKNKNKNKKSEKKISGGSFSVEWEREHVEEIRRPIVCVSVK